MKANFPVEYMAAVLTAEAGDVDTVSVMVAECKRMGIPVLPPDVNESFGDFTVLLGPGAERSEKAAALAGQIERDSIRFGLYSIKNFGRGIADAIISERKTNGRFKSLSDFFRRVKDQNLNKKALESPHRMRRARQPGRARVRCSPISSVCWSIIAKRPKSSRRTRSLWASAMR